MVEVNSAKTGLKGLKCTISLTPKNEKEEEDEQ